jgi:EAL domain-containing protein (putative c-di-GMP-specific phosphodiesterase class I)
MKVMSHAAVPNHRIEIEITEAVALQNAEHAGAIIQRLHAAGFAVALDDFGTGYSSLSYLKRYAIDRLKIDQSFVKDLVTNKSDQAIVNAVIHMAHSLQMTTIAEGVETEAQATLLQKLGCDEIQGYLISQPLLSKDFEMFLQG